MPILSAGKKGPGKRKTDAARISAGAVFLAALLVIAVFTAGCAADDRAATEADSFAKEAEKITGTAVSGVEKKTDSEYVIFLENGKRYTGFVHDVPAKVEGLECLYMRNEGEQGRFSCWIFPEDNSARYTVSFSEYPEEGQIMIYVINQYGGTIYQFPEKY